MNLSLLCGATILTAGSLFAAQDLIEKSFDVQPGGHLVMNVDRGSIHITTSKSGKVEVQVERELKRVSEKNARELFDLHQIQFEQAGNNVTIRAENPQKFWSSKRNKLNNMHVEYSVAIPSRFNVDVRTAGGNVDITTLEGQIQARTAGGNVTVNDARGNAELHTSGGHLRMGTIVGDLLARTSGGNIEVQTVSGAVDVQTSGGNIRIIDANSTVKASTSGGHVSARLNKQPTSQSYLKTSGGNVSVSLANGVAVDLDAHTSGGRIHSDFDGDFNKERTKLRAQVNGGGPDLVLSTSGGNVEVRRK